MAHEPNHSSSDRAHGIQKEAWDPSRRPAPTGEDRDNKTTSQPSHPTSLAITLRIIGIAVTMVVAPVIALELREFDRDRRVVNVQISGLSCFIVGIVLPSMGL